ncbi:glycosyltransferase family 2 protein [Pyrobaculum sp.]|uniref:glycosyltransferase family 2 protein n=2 Tax=Pyrobaculum sp. TaxID=2004705 RepID=UPI003174CAEA
MMPKVSVIWLNYNSYSFIDVVLKSISSLLNLNYSNFEIIIVDNASTDGSFEIITKYVELNKPSDVKVKIIRNDKNLGYTGGNNIGWEARDPESKYVVFINNDVIAHPDSLAHFIDYMESSEVAAANGLLYRDEQKNTIYGAGGYLDEWLTSILACGGNTFDMCQDAKKERLITYADGAYLVARVDAIRKFGFNGRPFIDEVFMYTDDVMLSLRLWNHGQKVAYFPIEAGIHLTSLTARKTGAISYYPLRGRFITHAFIKTRYFRLKYFYYLRVKMMLQILCMFISKKYCNAYSAVTDGYNLGRKLAKLYGYLSLYKAPYLKLDNFTLISRIFLPIRSMKKVL